MKLLMYVTYVHIGPQNASPIYLPLNPTAVVVVNKTNLAIEQGSHIATVSKVNM